MDVKSIIDNFKFVDPDNVEYLNKFKEVSVKYNGRGWNELPSQIILPWFGMNKMFSLGYDEDIYEFDNDIRCRKYIEPLINDEELNKYPEHQYFKDKVKILDEVYKEMSFEFEPLNYNSEGKFSNRPWWEIRVLRYASETYVYELEGLNLEIEPSKEPNKNYPDVHFFNIRKK